MRTIKFRAWDKLERKTDSPKFFTYFTLEDLNEGKIKFPDWENWEISMFTGLLSKDGKEIYEADVVKDKWGKQNTITLEPFEFSDWEDGCAGFGFYLQTHSLEDLNDVEIIGNIYENPELVNNK